MASSSSSRPHSTPMPDGPHILWLEKATKSASHGLHVGDVVGHVLAGVDDGDRTGGVGGVAQLANRRDRAEHVAHRREAEAPWRRRAASSRSVRSSWPSSVSGTQRSSMPRSAASMCHGTMLAWCSIWVSTTTSPARGWRGPTTGDQVERLGGVLGEDHLVGTWGVDEPRTPWPGALVGVGGLGGQLVGAAVDRRVRRLHEPRHRVDDRPRLLRRVRRVEVDDRRPSICRCSSGKSPLDAGDVERSFSSERLVAVAFELLGQLHAADGDDAAVDQDVDVVGRELVEQALVVGDQHDAHARAGRRGPRGCPWRRCAGRRCRGRSRSRRGSPGRARGSPSA